MELRSRIIDGTQNRKNANIKNRVTEKTILRKQNKFDKKIMELLLGIKTKNVLIWGAFSSDNRAIKHLIKLNMKIDGIDSLQIDSHNRKFIKNYKNFVQQVPTRKCKILILERLRNFSNPSKGLTNYLKGISKSLSFITQEFHLKRSSLGPNDLSKILVYCRHMHTVSFTECLIPLQSQNPPIYHRQNSKCVLSKASIAYNIQIKKVRFTDCNPTNLFKEEKTLDLLTNLVTLLVFSPFQKNLCMIEFNHSRANFQSKDIQSMFCFPFLKIRTNPERTTVYFHFE
ncbi:unnamed protein product [Moneuplotes crassus]|uniref:Uncharacterized protein n=1 Tax=Euplotes crassus TaxID=5936 RepID=A0AAD1XMH9_EUPCR|nr:unnamed protein product [Moneuplotes crassus]